MYKRHLAENNIIRYFGKGHHSQTTLKEKRKSSYPCVLYCVEFSYEKKNRFEMLTSNEEWGRIFLLTDNQLWWNNLWIYSSAVISEECALEVSVSSWSSVCPEDVSLDLPVILSPLAVTFYGIHIQPSSSLFPSHCFCFYWSSYTKSILNCSYIFHKIVTWWNWGPN